eukprot:scaffold15059_cov22-Tisochrysis_lutea.AAC.2
MVHLYPTHPLASPTEGDLSLKVPHKWQRHHCKVLCLPAARARLSRSHESHDDLLGIVQVGILGDDHRRTWLTHLCSAVAARKGTALVGIKEKRKIRRQQGHSQHQLVDLEAMLW